MKNIEVLLNKFQAIQLDITRNYSLKLITNIYILYITAEHQKNE
jgi:hypothetical protein